MFHSVTGGRVEKGDKAVAATLASSPVIFASRVKRLMKGRSATSNGNKGCQARAAPGQRLRVISELEMHL